MVLGCRHDLPSLLEGSRDPGNEGLPATRASRQRGPSEHGCVGPRAAFICWDTQVSVMISSTFPGTVVDTSNPLSQYRLTQTMLPTSQKPSTSSGRHLVALTVLRIHSCERDSTSHQLQQTVRCHPQGFELFKNLEKQTRQGSSKTRETTLHI